MQKGHKTPIYKDIERVNIAVKHGIKANSPFRKARLLMPSNNAFAEGVIAFYAYMSKSELNPGAHHTLIYDVTKTNAGHGYKEATGIFTAPTEGIYVFIWVTRIWTDAHSTKLMINTDIYGATFIRASVANDNSVSGTVVAYVRKGDSIFMRTHSIFAGNGNIESNYLGPTSFSGWLLQ
ncbi:C1QL [Mytilus coruscus]|uniref:C1QL n=1 Tax=Mytilus coruscus TaxID=42192 RepID=A0A6J8BCB4_MYTCO|nr:C1QL [Mytilus coruscus]